MKIYDCFTFFNELDLLEIRLNILNDQVDYFVLVESTKTHSAKVKELYFEKNKTRFSTFSKKIIHVIVDDMPDLKEENRWILENFQRNAIMRGLLNCKNDDIIIVSDLDEIPNLENIDYIKNTLISNCHENDYLYDLYSFFKKWISNIKNKSKIVKYIRILTNIFAIKSKKLVIFKQKFYYYFLNGLTNLDWYGSRAILYENLINNFDSKPQEIRHVLSKNTVRNGGWHFSCLSDAYGIAEKLHSFAHSEYDKTEYTDTEIIQKRIEAGEDVVGRKKININYIQIDNTYPVFIRENISRYTKYIKN